MGEKKNPVGAPRIMTPEMKAKAVEWVCAGQSIRMAAKGLKISHNVILKEQERDSEFATNLARAESECERRHLAGLEDSKNSDWRAHLAFLSRKWPSEWSERKDLHVHNNTPPVEVTETLVTTRAEAARFRDMTRPHDN
jgi:hypothetical protein